MTARIANRRHFKQGVFGRMSLYRRRLIRQPSITQNSQSVPEKTRAETLMPIRKSDGRHVPECEVKRENVDSNRKDVQSMVEYRQMNSVRKAVGDMGFHTSWSWCTRHCKVIRIGDRDYAGEIRVIQADENPSAR